MPYNLTAVATNSTSPLGFMQAVNNVLMDGWLGTLFLIVIVAITFMAFIYSTNDTNRSVAATSFIAFTLGLLMRALGLIGNLALFITLVAAAAAVAFTWKNN